MVNGNKFGLAGKCLLIGLPVAVALNGCEAIQPKPGSPEYVRIREARIRTFNLQETPEGNFKLPSQKQKTFAESLLWEGIVGATIDSLKKPKTEIKDPNNYSENKGSGYEENR